MLKYLKKITIILISFCLLAAPAISFAESGDKPEAKLKGPNAIQFTADLFIVRPIGIVLVPVGAVFFAVAYPFTLIDDSTNKAYEAFLGENIRYTFQRPLGEDLPI
ncbi:hypothetical protein [Desulfobacterium sp. N47]|uniref:Uncharacterized protein n=1 Tax=uncultured Desulfobacterium sp. TaxID=201089 RepID=E1Y9H6_9BACT|nr:unknown protein [uncultured Desulfobacterium sp.]